MRSDGLSGSVTAAQRQRTAAQRQRTVRRSGGAAARLRRWTLMDGPTLFVSTAGRHYSRDRAPTLPSLSQPPAGITAETGLLHCRVCLSRRPVLQQRQDSYTADISLCDRATHDLASILRRSGQCMCISLCDRVTHDLASILRRSGQCMCISLCDRVTHDLASILRRSVIGCRRFLPVIGPAPPPPASSVDRRAHCRHLQRHIIA